jgi:hypothetical protein
LPGRSNTTKPLPGEQDSLKTEVKVDLGRILGIFILLILIVGIIPFTPETKIGWTVYLGMPLIIFLGSAGIAFICKRIEAIICGMVMATLWPVFIEIIQLI